MNDVTTIFGLIKKKQLVLAEYLSDAIVCYDPVFEGNTHKILFVFQ